MTSTSSSHDHAPTATSHRHGYGHGMAETLDLDAAVLGEQLTAIVAGLPAPSSVRRIVDLGAGTGSGTLALLGRFPDARVVAVDGSAEHLAQLQEKCEQAGMIGDRIETVQADLDAGWPDLGRADLVWASASLHHVADPGRALRAVRDLLAPGGLLAVVELAGPPRFLPDWAPEFRPGVETRAHAAADRRINATMPTRGADWGPMISAAGYTLVAEDTVTVDEPRPHSEAVARYAQLVLGGLRGAAVDELADDDLAALDELLDAASPRSVLRRDDLRVRAERGVWAARP